MAKKRYAQVGLGGRSRMYTHAITGRFADTSELVGLCDNNAGRLALTLGELPAGYATVPTYPDTQFDRMVADTRPDVVIVTTRDSFHDVYIVRAMELGCDVVTEKPMTIDAAKCQRIVDTAQRTGRKVTVTFNYRYSPVRSQLKELLMAGTIGRILSVDFHWLLNTSHGADYYRRWHRQRQNSGGLMVHKATHHFDLVNWWISSTPSQVVCLGKREFYTEETAQRLGLADHSDRCHTCPVTDRCKFHLSLADNDGLKHMYLDQEHHDGYHRDQCVFGAGIDIEDSMNLVVRYANGVIMSYSLNAFCPWEGYTIAFNGTGGRVEHQNVETVYISGDGTVPGETVAGGTTIKVYPHFAAPYDVPIRTVAGGHGGGDAPLLVDVFGEHPPPDPLRRAATFAEGAWSILTGVAANQSMRTGEIVDVASLVSGLPQPNVTPVVE